MLTQNKKLWDVSGIGAWQKAGYTGKGINIAVMDDAFIPHPFTKAICPLDDSIPIKSGAEFHKPNSCSVNREVCPDANIYALNWFGNAEATTKWLIENKRMIDVVNCSFESPRDSKKELLTELSKLDIPFIFASGNESSNKPCYPADMGFGIIMSAYHMLKNEIPAYANIGPGVDALAYTYVYIPNSQQKPFAEEGTSAGASLTTGMVALYIQWRKKHGFPKLTADICKKHIKRNGHGNVDGYKIYRLPLVDELEYKVDTGVYAYSGYLSEYSGM